MKMMVDQRQTIERSVQGSARYDSDESSSSDTPDEWGFFVDIGEQLEERAIERTFLNGFNASNTSKLRTITDSRF